MFFIIRIYTIKISIKTMLEISIMSIIIIIITKILLTIKGNWIIIISFKVLRKYKVRKLVVFFTSEVIIDFYNWVIFFCCIITKVKK